MSPLFNTLFVSFSGIGNAALEAVRGLPAAGPLENEGNEPEAPKGLTIVDPVTAAREYNELTAKALKEPFKDLWSLRRNQEDRLREKGDDDGAVQKLRLIAQFEPFDRKLSELDKVLQRTEARLLGKELRKDLARAVETGDLKTLDGWDEKLGKLMAYAQAEARKTQVLNWAKGKYPEEGRFALELDFSAENPRVAPYLDTCRPSGPCEELSQFEPSVGHYRKLPIVRVYEELKHSQNEDDQRIATAAEHALSDHDFFENWPLNGFVLPGADGVKSSWDGLEQATRLLGNTYGSKELDKDLQAFGEKMAAKEKEELENNEGYKTRKEFGVSIKALEGFDADIAAAKLTFEEFEGKHDVSKLDFFSKFLSERVASCRDLLRSEEARIAKEDAVAAGVPNMDGTDQVAPPPPPSDRLIEVQDKLARAEAALKKIAETDGTDRKGQFETLSSLTPDVAAMEDEHARILLEKIAEMAKGPDAAVSPLSLDGASEESFKDRAGRYGGLEAGIRKDIVLRMVEGRIKQYEAYQGEQDTKKGITDVMKAPFALMGPEPEMRETRPEITNWDMIHAYREIQGELKSGEEFYEKKALEDLTKLESIRGHQYLSDLYESNSLFNGIIGGIPILIAAAATGGIAAELAAPFVEGVAGGSAILTGINGTVFTLTQKILDAALRGKNIADEVFQGSTLLECGLNSVMFGWMNRVMGRFEKYFEKGLDVIARRNVAQSLGRALVDGDADLIAKEATALRENAGVKVAKAASGFVYEAAKFQQWGFYVEVGRGIAGGDSQPVEKALKRAFSADSILQNAQFLVGIKVAGLASMPLFGPLQEGAHRWALGKRVEMALKAIDADIGGLQERFDEALVSGKGDAGEIAGRLKDRLAAREQLISEVPEEFQNDHFRQVKDLHREVRENLESFEKLAAGMKDIFGAEGRFGVKILRDGDGGGAVMHYERSRKGEFRQSLNKLLGGWNVKVLGDVIEATFWFPGGAEQTLVFSPS